MSKLCESEEKAKETVEWYKQNEPRYDSPDYRKSEDGKHWVVYNKSSNKVLKNKNYIAANFDEILADKPQVIEQETLQELPEIFKIKKDSRSFIDKMKDSLNTKNENQKTFEEKVKELF